ncbi:MAG: ABC transporter ATP-binding protein [Hyphomonas sp.]|uniref:ABC transporter ATP-binding protein n=1 Tax=Hyphomonas sp. TaxID=87 RepID=UPI00180D76F9|nr:ABC transporter ATP-binding protein [Hyphomonas sp.]MBA3067936.1 ABC transporter ATP-binding protein [Hyphomonas sp.]MBU4061274.1 ABC transporter ATP-binding protein [Alphaproteobacteria bacterium]MBU4162527.1 ABC transporter ATP-binding protein [Alphaproteobacteria bacterium]MBU4568562.1 ABC transporter ATP-binding protein [Alphaproteobacteria bacterium]
MKHRLEARGVTRRYGARAVVDDVSLTLEPGVITALLGGSGAGKSTLLRLLAGLEPVDGGEIRLGDRILSAPGRTVPAEQRRIGLIFQDFALFPHLTAARNVAFGLRHLPRNDAEARVRHWTGLLGLEDRAGAYPHELSGGEQQRVAIARALAPEPDAILMDEPFSGLDPMLSESVREAALTAVRAAGIPALMVTHDPAEALAHADNIAILRHGRLLQCGSPDEVYRRPVSLPVARSLGPVNEIPAAALPDAWRHLAAKGGAGLAVRPEGVLIDPASSVRLKVTHRRLAGPMVRLTLEGAGLRLQSLALHSLAPQVGDETGISLDPILTFTFASGGT